MRHQHRLSVAAAFLLLWGLLTFSVSARDGVLTGNGTAEAPYAIEDAADLAAFRDKVNAEASSTAHAVLKADIDLENKEWKRIYPDSGYITEAYAGTFDGAGHTIKGLKVNGTTIDQGLFGAIGLATVDGNTVTAVIKNLKVEGTVTSTASYVGGIVGRVNAGSILNCSFSGSVTTTKSNGNLGGIVGYINGDKPEKKPVIVLSGCVNRATVSSGTKGTVAGGIVGYAKYAEITSCYNVGSISGTSRTGGIGGQLQNNVSAVNCYTAGGSEAVTGFLYSSSTLNNCHSLGVANAAGTGTATGCTTIDPENKAALLALLGSAYKADEAGVNNGYPMLAWETGAEAPKEPALLVSGATLSVTGADLHPTTTLTATFRDMDEQSVVWSIESGETVIELVTPENAADHNTSVVVRVLTPGKAVVKVVTTDGKYTASCEILAVPQLTGREIGGTVAVGFTVCADITVLGGKTYDYDNYPALDFQWKYLTAEEYLGGQTGESSYHLIDAGTTRSFTIPASLEGCYLSYTVTLAVRTEMPSSPIRIRSNAEGCVESDRAALALDTSLPIKEALTLSLAAVGENGSTIAWSSDAPEVIDPTTGVVTLPKKNIVTVTLTAVLSKDDASSEKTFVFTVYSTDALNKELADKEKRLDKAVRALRKSSTLKPVFGTDTNVKTMLSEKLAAVGEPEVTISITDVETVYDGASIDETGVITYFFADPNTAPSRHSATLNVTFALSLDEAEKSYTAKVVVPWDAERVKALMREELLDGVTVDGSAPLTEEFTLPTVVDDKRWTLVSWSSSDDTALSVKEGADKTRPMTAVLHRGREARAVTLTAAFTFGFTATDEPEIVLYKTFDVTVAALDEASLEEIRAFLEEKLEAGFAKAGLCDVSGTALTPDENGVYTVSGDILYPTTRDFGVDGKTTPVTITSQNETLVVSPDTANAARTTVYRPMVGEPSATTTVTVTLTDKESGVAVSKDVIVCVQPLTEDEIEAEKLLMEKVLASYFEGIRGKNTDKGNIRYDLKPFSEVYEKDGTLVWVRDSESMVGHGIVPDALEGWQTLEAWRLFRSSNPTVITHENLLVALQSKAKAVTVDSVLSSETLGRYGELYKNDPETYAKYAPLADLYAQPVSVDLIVRGKYNASNTAAPVPVEETYTVFFSLKNGSKNLIKKTVKDLPDGTTVLDVFNKLLEENGYTCVLRGGYLASVTTADGTVLEEFGAGPNSGWMFKVNGKFPDTYMSGCGIQNDDEIVVFYTDDYMKEFSDMSSDSSSSRPSNSTSSSAKEEEKKEEKEEEEKTDLADKTEETGNTEKTETEVTEQPTALTFTDIKGHWAEAEIANAVEKGYMKGVSDELFAPDESLTRAMFVTILYRVAGLPANERTADFSDVPQDAWFAEAVTWAFENGIVRGVSDTLFAPNESVTREQMALILYRYAAKDEEMAKAAPFTDLEGLSEESVKAVAWAYASGVIKGMTETTFEPQGQATRAQAAAIFVRFAK